MAGIHPRGNTSGAKAQNADFFGADLIPVTDVIYASKFRVAVALSLAVTLEVTLDGIVFVLLNAGDALGAEQLFVFDVPTLNGNAFNLRIPDVGGATVRYCRVDEVISEA